MRLAAAALAVAFVALFIAIASYPNAGPRTYADCVVHSLQGMPAPLTQMGAMINNDAVETACKQRFPN